MPIRSLTKRNDSDPSRPRRGTSALLAALLLAVASPIPAHDIPASVTVFMFVKPEGSRLRVLVRAPLQAMRDFNFPVRGPGYLDLAKADSLVRDAARIWVADYLEPYEGGTRLGTAEITAVRVSLPSDRSFGSYEDALAHLTGAPLPESTQIIWQQAMLDVLLEYPIQSVSARFSIHPGLAHLGITTRTVLRFLPSGGAERAFQYTGDPGLVRLDPRWHQAAWQFVKLGFFHILNGLDHLLFVLCLVIPVRRLRPLVMVVTSFTVAHSITLIASATGLAPTALWFPPLIETLIAMSIVYMALENIVGARVERRWMIAFGFGLVHGFGFSFILRDSMQFAGSHLVTSLLSFNLGVEFGQLFLLVLALPALALMYRHVVPERMGVVIVSALVAHTGWHWMTDRASALREYQFQWPALDRAFLAGAMRGLMLVLILAGAVWGLYVVFGRLLRRKERQEAA